MSIRAKTKRRLLILMACTITASALLAGLVVYRVQAREKRMSEYKALGYEAFEKGDWRTAMVNLQRYTRANPKDADALFKFAVARKSEVQPDGRHIGDAIVLFTAVLELDYTHEEAQNHLLELYRNRNFAKDGLALAERVLARDPRHAGALKTKAFAHFHQIDYKSAYEAAMKAAELTPADLQIQTLVLESMARLNQPREKLLEYAQSLKDQHPGDPRFDLLVGTALEVNGKRLEAVESLRRAAAAEPPDQEFVEALTRQFDSLGLFRESLELLHKAAEKLSSAELRTQYIRRLFQSDRAADALVMLDKPNTEIDSKLLGVKVLALLREGKKPEAAAARDVLIARTKTDAIARGWEYLVNIAVDAKSPAPNEIVTAMGQALDADPFNPYTRNIYARAWMQMNETDKAIEQWTLTASIAPSWVEPYIGLAQARLEAKEPRQAVVEWQRALQRSPSNAIAVIGFSETMGQLIRAGDVDAKEAEKIVKVLAQVHERQPGEPLTLATYLDMLAYAGKKEEAIAFLNKVLADPPAVEKLNQRSLMMLVDVSSRQGLGADEKLKSMLEGRYGDSPALVFAQAIRASREDPAKGRAMMLEEVKKHPDDKEWLKQWGRFLDALEDDESLEVWRDLSQRHPDDTELQQMVIGSPAVQNDPKLLEAAIERLKKATGEDGTAWKLARARYLLTQSQGDAEAHEAITILTPLTQRAGGRTEPFVLLAAAYQRLGNNVAAAEQLSIAQSLQPDNLNISLQLIQLRRALGALAEMRQLIDAVDRSKDATPAQRRQIAAILADLGELKRAETILDELKAGEQGDLVLASIYVRNNDAARAQQQYEKLMARSPNAAVIRGYADYLRAVGRGDQAVEVLARLKRLDLAPGVTELLLAEHYQRFGDVDRAVEYYEEAAAHERARESAYRELIRIRLEQKRFDEAMAFNDQARKALPGNPLFTLLQSNRELIGRTLERPVLLPMIGYLINSPQYRDAALQVMELADSGVKANAPVSATLLQARQVADKNPQFLGLQVLMSDWYLATGNLSEAARIATRTMSAFPSDAESARRAAVAFARMGRWGESLDAATQWRTRAPGDAYKADVAIASAHLGAGRAQQAKSVLEPYRTAALGNPEAFNEWIVLQCRALIAMGDIDAAQGVLKPLIFKARGWREVWMSLAVSSIADPAVAAGWLETVGKTVPEGDVAERARLAEMWITLSDRAKNPQFRAVGMAILKHLYENAATDIVPVAMLYALNAQLDGDLELAATAYRRVLSVQPDNRAALNNLAMVLVESGKNLDDALGYANKVNQLAPNEPVFLDTLGQVQIALKQYDKAVESLTKAVDLDPKNPEWSIKLAKAEAGRGKYDVARLHVNRIKSMLLGADPLSAPLQVELDALEAELAKQAKAGN